MYGGEIPTDIAETACAGVTIPDLAGRVTAFVATAIFANASDGGFCQHVPGEISASEQGGKQERKCVGREAEVGRASSL
jgi:hypothetical protein